MSQHSKFYLATWLLALPVHLAHGQGFRSWTDPSPHRVQFITVEDSVLLEVLDWGGSGRPIVLLAGLGNTAHVFDEFAPKLTKAGHVYGITRRGYGASSRPEFGYTAERLGNDVLAVLDTLSLVRSLLIGHSIAGQELSFVASNYADRVAGVVYLDAAYRYAYYRPGVQENVRELRKRLELLDAELSKPPRSPAELSHTIETIMDDALEEVLQDLHELITTPNLPHGPPPPRPEALKDFAAYRAWSTRVQGFSLPEAELRQVQVAMEDGSVGPAISYTAAAQAIRAGSQHFTQIAAPALAIFASPHALGPWTKDYLPDQTAFDAFARFDQAMTERQAAAFERGVKGSRVVRLANASHYIFVTNESDVLRQVMAFLATLR